MVTSSKMFKKSGLNYFSVKMIRRFISSTVNEFRVFNVGRGRIQNEIKRKPERQPRIPRYKQMRLDQEWTNVWPHAQCFKSSVVPMPIRQGMVTSMLDNEGVVPDKNGNTELMKIPNFLHLTPTHVQKHCSAIKKFCTEFPVELKDPDMRHALMPVDVETVDYVQSSCSIRDERSRIVKISVKLEVLQLSGRSRDKLIRLLGPDRYEPKTGRLSITADKCPYRNQNYDYAKYLLDVVYNECIKREAWEDTKCPEDWERYYWESSETKKTLTEMLSRSKLPTKGKEKVEGTYRKAITQLFDKVESKENIEKYRESVERILNICSK